MPFTVEEFHDLVRLLEEHPQWRAELRRLLLTEELLELPALVREWVEAQREFEVRTEERLGNLEVRLMEFEARTEERFQALAEEVRELARAQREFEARTEERLGNLEVRLIEFEARTEERFQALAEEVRKLAEAHREFEARTEERLGNLEVRLMEFEARTEERFQALAEEVRELARAQREFEARTEERLGNLEVRVGNLEVRLMEFEARTEERFQALAEEVRKLAEAHREFEARTEERFQALVEAQVRTEQRLGELAQQVRSLLDWQRGEAGRREGERYEQRIVRDAPYLFGGGDGGATNDPVVRVRLSQWLAPLFRGEKVLEPEERPTLADLLWWKGEKVLVVEVSLKVNGSDVLRAHRRAQTLRQVGVDAVAVVVGEDWASLEARELAKEKGVWWFVGGVPSEGLVEFRRLEG